MPKEQAGQNGSEFHKWQRVDYFSVSQKGWVYAQIIAVDEEGQVMLDVKENYWIPIEEQDEKLRPVERVGYAADQELQYRKLGEDKWTGCNVTQLKEDQTIEIDKEPGRFFTLDEQDSDFRFLCEDKSEELRWEADRAREDKRLTQAETLYRELLVLEPWNVRVMDLLANVLRDQGDGESAERMWFTALDEDPYDLRVLSDLMDLLRVRGRSQDDPDMKKLASTEKGVKDKLREIRYES